jgi:hypothetical protein
MEAVQKTMRDTMQQVMQQTIAEQMKDLNEAQKKTFQEHMNKVTGEMLDVYPLSEMLQDMTPAYQKNYSREEIDALVTFYTSPMGSRLLEKQPKVMQEAMTLMMPKMQAKIREKLANVQQESMDLAQELAKEKDNPAPKK